MAAKVSEDQGTLPMTIPEFCQYYGISEATFFRHRDNMPRIIKFGRCVRITPAARQDWESKQERREQRRCKIR